MKQEAIGILFEVKGKGDIDKGSGELIKRQLKTIAKNINQDPVKIKIIANTDAFKKSIEKIKIKKIPVSLKVNLKDVKDAINAAAKTSGLQVTSGKSGSGAKGKNNNQKYNRVVSDYFKRRKEIEKIQQEGGDISNKGRTKWQTQNPNYDALVKDANRLAASYSRLGVHFTQAGALHIKTSKQLGISSKERLALEQRIQKELTQLTIDSQGRSLKATQDAAKEAKNAEKEKVDAYKATIDEWIKYSKRGTELSTQVRGLSRSKDGSISGTDSRFKKEIALINENAAKVKDLDFFDASGSLKSKFVLATQLDTISQKLGITKESVSELYEHIISGMPKVEKSVEEATRKSDDKWEKYSKNVRQQVLGMYRVISKDPTSKELADKVLKMSRDSSIGIVGLRDEYNKFLKAVRESGADIETWGDKLKNTISGKVRGVIAASIVTFSSKTIRDIYKNVIELDKSVVDLQIASGKTREETKLLVKEYADLAKQLGSTTAEVSAAADTWLRQGYSAEEAGQLIKNSTMLSKLGQLESAEASKALTSAMKGYKVAVEDSISVVDKFTAVDMAAAASAGDIATAMAETATGAKLAGVSMDKLIGYATVVKEVTQDNAESVGTFLKTMFARMNNVKAGKFVDDETGESLNDVEKVLNEVNVSLRNSNGLFRDSSDVLDEVAQKWNTLNNVEQHAIATAIAGTRQQEKLIVLLSNYSDAMKYTQIAAESSGTAVEKYGSYLSGIQGTLEGLKASFESLSLSILDSDMISSLIKALSTVISIINKIISFSNGFIGRVALVAASLYMMQGTFTKLGGIITTALGGGLKSFGDFVAAIQLGGEAIGKSLLKAFKNPYVWAVALFAVVLQFQDKWPKAAKIAVSAIMLVVGVLLLIPKVIKAIDAKLATSPIGLIIIGITALVGGLVLMIKSLTEATNKSRQSLLDAAKAAQEHADALKETAAAARETSDSIEELVEKAKEEEKITGTSDEWLTTIESIGEEVAKLFPDEHLTHMQAIRRLLEEQYNYTRLISADENTRNEILGEITAKSKELAALKAREAYSAQAAASGALLAGLTHEYDLKNQDVDWYGKEGSDISAAITEAEKIASSVNGVSMSVNAGWDIDIKIEGKTLSDYIKNAEAAIEAYKKHYGGNDRALGTNAIYQYLTSQLAEAKKAYAAEGAALSGYVDIIAEIKGNSLNIEDTGNFKSIDDAKTVYETAISNVSDEIKKDKTIADAVTNGHISEEEIREAAEKYLMTFKKELFNAANPSPIIIPVKTTIGIYDEVEGEINALTTALEELNESGSVSAKTIKSITEEFPDLLEYIEETDEGFKFKEDGFGLDTHINKLKTKFSDKTQEALDAYKALLAVYKNDSTAENYDKAAEAYKQYEQALQNEKNLSNALNYLTKDTLLTQYTKILEDQKTALEKQVDAYSEICDARKELLQTYKDEMQYLRELEKKTSNVTKLSTKLAIAQLDQSAAGQARARELEAELTEAQEDLDDFTLERAIDEITNDIESSNVQFSNLIKEQVESIETTIMGAAQLTADAISKAITGEGKTPNVNANDGGDGVEGGNGDDVETLGNRPKETNRERYQRFKEAGVSVLSEGQFSNRPVSQKYSNYREYLDSKEEDYNAALDAKKSKELEEAKEASKSDYTLKGYYPNGPSAGAHDIDVVVDGKGYQIKVCRYGNKENISDPSLVNNAVPFNSIGKHDGAYYIKSRYTESDEEGNTTYHDYWAKIKRGVTTNEKAGYDGLMTMLKEDKLKNVSIFHTGGIVEDTTLKSTEVFAKLLKGELVSTPAQMSRFMQKTLPNIANYTSSTGGTNEFNAPLISITCGSVTQDALPGMKNIVNEAVKEIQRQLDGGMSRAGYKKSLMNRL